MATKTATGKANTVATTNDNTNPTENEQENEHMETADETINQFAQFQRDIKDSRTALRVHEKHTMDLLRQKAKPEDVRLAIEKLAAMQETLDHHKKALHDAKIGSKRENKPLCAWCVRKPAKEGGFCSMKHAAEYGKAQYKDFAYGSPELFSDATYKLVTGSEKP